MCYWVTHHSSQVSSTRGQCTHPTGLYNFLFIKALLNFWDISWDNFTTQDGKSKFQKYFQNSLLKKVFNIKIEDPTLTTQSEQIQRKINKAALIYFVITLPASVIFANNERWFFSFHHNFEATLALFFSRLSLHMNPTTPALNFSVIFSTFSY